jgi:hypothetical protein
MGGKDASDGKIDLRSGPFSQGRKILRKRERGQKA